jgi:hypothetical protein
MDDDFEIPIAYRYECQDVFKDIIMNRSEEEKAKSKAILTKWRAVLDGPSTPLSAFKLTPEPFEAKIKNPLVS